MPLYVHLDVGIDSCELCATALDTLAASAESAATQLKSGRDKSEAEWKSDAGDDFRDSVGLLVKAAEDASDNASALAAALRAFVADMRTAHAAMNRAVSCAVQGGLWAGPDLFDAAWIGDPDPLPTADAATIELSTKHVEQVDAFATAEAIVIEARAVEQRAHDNLAAALSTSDGMLDGLTSSAPWMLAGGIFSYVGTAAQQADQWGKTAAERAGQLARFNTIASDLGPQGVKTAAAAAATVFGSAADDAARVAAQNASLLPKAPILDKILAASIKGFDVAGPIGKLPYAGVALTAGQTIYDLKEAESAGDAAKIVAKDAGGFLAGSAATTLLLASAAGGPATIAAVGVGIFVTWGVGELIERAVD